MLTQILIIVLVILAVIGVRSIMRERQRIAREHEQVEQEQRRGSGKTGSTQPARTEDMVQCLHCGVYVPRSASVHHRGDTFCCDAHRAAHRG